MSEAASGARQSLRAGFIAAQGWGDAVMEDLPADASLRTYHRLRNANGETMMLMDAPPAKGENVRPFIRIDRHLIRLGLAAPVIHAADEEQGFLLLEDFGDATFTRLLAAGHDEADLYARAVDVVIRLHTRQGALAVDTTSYMTRFIPQAEWLLQWYIPDALGVLAGEECNRTFYAAWDKVLRHLPEPRTVLMLRDFHVDNLMLIRGREGLAACGLLDFQDAEFAPRPYDLVCLLEDARRDVPQALQEAMLARYDAAAPIDDSFRAWYAAIAVQRHMRVIGNFARLAVRDHKPQYRTHIPRVFGYLNRALEAPVLAPVRAWTEKWLPPGTG